MKVELDITSWVLANNLGPKNRPWPNLAASWRPKPFIPLRKSIKKTMYQIKIGQKKKKTKKLIFSTGEARFLIFGLKKKIEFI